MKTSILEYTLRSKGCIPERIGMPIIFSLGDPIKDIRLDPRIMESGITK